MKLNKIKHHKRDKLDSELRSAVKARRNTTGVERDYWQGFINSIQTQLGEKHFKKPHINAINIGTLNSKAKVRGYYDGLNIHIPSELRIGFKDINYVVFGTMTGAVLRMIRERLEYSQSEFAKLFEMYGYQSIQMVERMEEKTLSSTWQIALLFMDKFGLDPVFRHGKKQL